MSPDKIAKLIEHLPPWAQPTPGNMLRYCRIHVDLVPGTPVTSLWCDTCLLPTRYEVPVHVLAADGPVQVGTFSRCDEHQP